MLTSSILQRHLDAKDHRRLVLDVMSNGRCRRGRIDRRLLEPPAVVTVGLGLALQREIELSYAPSPLACRLVRSLLAMQADTGWFGSSDPAASRVGSAFACRGLLDFCAPEYQGPMYDGDAGDARLAWLASAAARGARRALRVLFDPTMRGADVQSRDAGGTASIIRWQLPESLRQTRHVQCMATGSTGATTRMSAGRHDTARLASTIAA